MNCALGIDLGGSSVKAVAVTPEGRTLAQRNLGFDAGAKLDWAGKVREVARYFTVTCQSLPSFNKNACDGKTGCCAVEKKFRAFQPSFCPLKNAEPWTLFVPERLLPLLREVDLAELCIVSAGTARAGAAPEGAFTLPDVADIGVVVVPASGTRCERCWRVLPEVGDVPGHDDLFFPFGYTGDQFGKTCFDLGDWQGPRHGSSLQLTRILVNSLNQDSRAQSVFAITPT